MKPFNLTRVFIILLVLFSVSNKKVSATNLEAGDVAFTQVNYYNGVFDFILLKAIDAGTEIMFTDYSYTSTNGLVNQSYKSSYEKIGTYTAINNMPAGSIIHSEDNDDLDDFNFRSSDGETIIAFQVYEGDTTYLSAIGWMSDNNFIVSTASATSEIPPGLSFEDNTVVQLSPSSKWYFTYSSRNGVTGSAYYLKSLFANPNNFQTWNKDGTKTYGTYTVLPDDTIAPVLESSSPEMSTTNASRNTNVTLVFDQTVNMEKGAVLKKEGLNIYSLGEDDISKTKDNEIMFYLEGKLEANTSYTITMPDSFIVDNDGNYWPSVSTDFNFSTASDRNNISLSFNPEDIVDQSWVSLTSGEGYAPFSEYGYSEFTENDIVCKHYLNINEYEAIIHPTWREEIYGALDCLGGGEIALVDLSPISSQIKYLKARVMANCTPVITNVYYNGAVVQTDTIFDGTSNSSLTENQGEFEGFPYANVEFHIPDNQGADSIIVTTLEGSLYQLDIEFSGQVLPTVDLGADQILCYGDSTILSTSKTTGDSILWSTGNTCSSITVKTSGTYTLTKTNSLGSASDDIQILFSPELVYPFSGDTITACMGEITEINAGISELTYIWDDTTMTHNTRSVSESKWYKVNISNPDCWSIRDSVYVEFTGGSLIVTPEQTKQWNTGDIEGQLYKEDANGNYELYAQSSVFNYFMFDNLPTSNYIFKAHILDPTQDALIDTYHNGGIVWEEVTPITITCSSIEEIEFKMHDALGDRTYVEDHGDICLGTIINDVPRFDEMYDTLFHKDINDYDSIIVHRWNMVDLSTMHLIGEESVRVYTPTQYTFEGNAQSIEWTLDGKPLDETYLGLFTIELTFANVNDYELVATVYTACGFHHDTLSIGVWGDKTYIEDYGEICPGMYINDIPRFDENYDTLYYKDTYDYDSTVVHRWDMMPLPDFNALSQEKIILNKPIYFSTKEYEDYLMDEIEWNTIGSGLTIDKLDKTTFKVTFSEARVYELHVSVYTVCGYYQDTLSITVDDTVTKLSKASVQTDVKVYPNPAKDKIQLSSIYEISEISIFNALGTKIINKKVEGHEVEVNLTGRYQQGIHFIKVVTRDNGEYYLKILIE